MDYLKINTFYGVLTGIGGYNRMKYFITSNVEVKKRNAILVGSRYLYIQYT